MADGSVVIESKMDNKQLASGLNEMQGKLQSAGGKLKDIGGTLTKSLTVPIAAAATGAVAMAASFDDSMRKVKATMGDNLGSSTKEADANFKALRDEAMKLGSTTAHSASDASGAMQNLAQMGFDTNQILAATPPILDAASASGLELDFVAGTIASSMNQFGVEVDDSGRNVTRFGDVMVRAGQISGTSLDEIGQALEYVGSSANEAGMDIEQTSAYLGVLGDAGLTGSKAGNALNAMFRDMKQKVKDGNLEFGEFNVAMYDSNGEMRDMTDIMVDLESGLEGMSQEQKDAAINAVFGSQSQNALNKILGQGTDSVKDYENQLRNAKGTSADARDEMEAGMGGAMRNLQSATAGLAIELGTALAPVVQNVAEFISDLMNRFAGLSDETKDTIVKVGLLLAALGPVLMILGSLLSVIGAVTGGIAAFTGGAAAATGAAGGLAAVLGFIASPAGLAVVAIGGIVLASKKLYDHLSQEAIPEVERFGDEVSENTQEAVGAFMDMSEEADVALKEIAWSQKEVTQDMANDMKEKQQAITDNLLGAIDERHASEEEKAKEQFENMDSLNETQKERILWSLDQRFEKEAEKAERGHERINEITQNAADKERNITKAESEEILAIRESMTKQAVKVMSQNELEQKAILEKMEHNSGTITAREAAEVVKNATSKKDDVIAEANEQYDETVAWAIQQRDEMGTLSKEEARAVIEEAQNKRDDSVDAAEDMHSKVVKEAKAQAKEHVDEVDWSTGEIKSKWDIVKSNVSTKVSEMGTAVKTKFGEMSTTVSTKMGEIKKWVNTNIVDSARDIKTKAGEMASNLGTNLSTMASDASSKMGDVKEAVRSGISGALTSISERYQEFKNAGARIGGNIADGIRSATNKVRDAASGLASKVRDFLPFSPAKEGPLKDLDKLDFGGPIEDSLKNAIPNVQAEMNHLLKVPNMNYGGTSRSPDSVSDNSKKFGDMNLTIVSPENTPSENARQIKKVGEELARGY